MNREQRLNQLDYAVEDAKDALAEYQLKRRVRIWLAVAGFLMVLGGGISGGVSGAVGIDLGGLCAAIIIPGCSPSHEGRGRAREGGQKSTDRRLEIMSEKILYRLAALLLVVAIATLVVGLVFTSPTILACAGGFFNGGFGFAILSLIIGLRKRVHELEKVLPSITENIQRQRG